MPPRPSLGVREGAANGLEQIGALPGPLMSDCSEQLGADVQESIGGGLGQSLGATGYLLRPD